ncbi:MAG TPA: alkaline phosphatase family protein, partial [Conexibacter sp.]|nr:alkaline phosphatase family protein [Conexibacter sp.]
MPLSSSFRRPARRLLRAGTVGGLATAIALAGCGGAPRHVVASARGGGLGMRTRSSPRGIHAIRHVIVVMQENRSFDSYFGTFPG